MLSSAVIVTFGVGASALGKLFSDVGQEQRAKHLQKRGSRGCNKPYLEYDENDNHYTCCAKQGQDPICVRSSDIQVQKTPWYGGTFFEADCGQLHHVGTPTGWLKSDACDEGSFIFKRKHGDFVRESRVTIYRNLARNKAYFEDLYDWEQGHWPEDLGIVYDGLKKAGCRNFVWLAGDSTLDNKYCFRKFPMKSMKAAVNGYEHVLDPPKSPPDVSYLLNERFHETGRPLCAINTARAGSTLTYRLESTLYAQDKFLRDHVSEDDVLVVSVGGNDFLPFWYQLLGLLIRGEQSVRTLTTQNSPSLRKLVDLFKDGTAKYINKLRNRDGKLPKVIVCSPYYYTENPVSRKGLMFKALEYAPVGTLQAIFKRIAELGTSKIQLAGTQVRHIDMYNFIDGKTAADYTDGIHLSEQGGRKMVGALMGAIQSLAL